MIVRTACDECEQPYEILVQPSETDLVKELLVEYKSVKCPRCSRGHIPFIGCPDISNLKEPLHLTGKELFQAVNGLGLPDEIPVSAIVLDAMLRADPVVETKIRQVGKYFFLDTLHLKSGVVVHLTAGSSGAQILKITR